MTAFLPNRVAGAALGAALALLALAAAAPPRAPVPRREPTSQRSPAAEEVPLRGRVELPAGTPADERVVVRAFTAGGALLAETALEPDGAFTLSVPASARAVRLDLRARWVRLARPRLASARDAEPPVLRPELGGRVEGRVLELLERAPAPEDAAGLEDAAGAATPAERRARSGEPPRVTLIAPNPVAADRVVRTVPLADGRFAFDAVPPGGPALLVLEGAGPAATRATLRVEPGRTTTVELAPARGGRIEGSVVGADGAPLAGAHLVAESLVRGAAPTRSVDAAATGNFGLAGLSPGGWRLRADAPGHQAAERELQLSEGDVLHLRLELAPTRTLRGRVTWPDGAPAAGARVTACVEARWRNGIAVAVTHVGVSDGHGRFAVADLPDGRAALRAELLLVDRPPPSAEQPVGHVPVTVEPPDACAWRAARDDVPATADDVVLVLDVTALAGRVVDDLGRPVERFVLRAARVEPPLGPCPMEAPAEEVRARFASEDGGFVLAGLRAGAWRVTATAEDESLVAARAEVRALGNAEPLVLVAPRAAALAGLVRDAAGEPCAGATVRAVLAPGEAPSHAETVRTDAEGHYAIARLEPGALRLEATLAGHAPSAPLEIVLAPGAEHVVPDLRLRAPGRLVGRVDPSAGRLAHRHVHVDTADGRREQTTTDAGGRFVVAGLAPGRHLVRLAEEGFHFDVAFPRLDPLPELDERAERRHADDSVHEERLDAELGTAGRTRPAAEVVIREGADTELVLAAPPGPLVHGRVTVGGVETEPPARGSLRFTGALDGDVAPVREVELDARGRYAVTLPAPGTWAVRLPGGTTRSLVVPALARYRADFALP